MADTKSKEARSKNMSRIRNKNTGPEELVCKYLFSQGFRYRKNVKKLPGTPDIVLPKYKTVVFVNGCFWHGHDCKAFSWPQDNAEFWREKITKNKERDVLNIAQLTSLGWHVGRILACEAIYYPPTSKTAICSLVRGGNGHRDAHRIEG